MRITLPRPLDLDLAATVTSHGWYRLAPFEWDGATGKLTHVDRYDATVSRITIRSTKRKIVIDAAPGVDPSLLRERIRRMLQLHVDLSDFHDRCRRSERLGSIPAASLGRLLCAPTFFEDAVKIILTSNTRWKRTIEMNRRLVEAFGPGTGSERAFPGPAELDAAGPDEIAREGRVGYRARTIHALATRLASGEIDPASRPDPLDGSYEDLHDWYLQLPGIGPYGAAHLAAMDGRYDRIAVDTEFRTWARNRFHGGRAVRDSTLLAHYRDWGPWKYMAYWCESMNER